MIALKELNPKNFPTSPEINANLTILLDKMNVVRSAYGKAMTVTSGLRSIPDHKRIYREKGVAERNIPMKSKHLYGQACDIADPKGHLQKWCLANEPLLKSLGLFLEDFSATKGWVHFQIVKYGSYYEGKPIYFLP